MLPVHQVNHSGGKSPTSGKIASIKSSHIRGRNTISRAGHDYSSKVDADAIYKATQHHKSYTWNATTLKGLDKYNDCIPYGVSEDYEKEILLKEISRLIPAAVKDESVLFDSEGQLASDTDTAFGEVASLADQIRCAMGIIRLDNARISLEHSSDLEESIHAFRQARRRLMGRFQTDQSDVLGSAPSFLEPEKRNRVLLFKLIDFVTSNVARLLVRTAASDYWSQQALSCVATCAMKIKVLARDTEGFANVSIATAESTLEDINQRDTQKEALVVKVRPRPNDTMMDIDTVDMETDASRFYYYEKSSFNREVYWLVRRVLSNLLMQENRKSSPSSFEIHTTLSSASPDKLPTALTSDRLGELSVSSDPFVIKNTHTALEMLIDNLTLMEKSRYLKPPQKEASTISQETDGKTNITCEWKCAKTGQGGTKTLKIETNDVDQVVSVVVPLSFCSILVAQGLARLVSTASIHGDERDPILRFEQPPRYFEGRVLVTTAGWKRKEHELSKRDFKDIDLVNLADAPMWLNTNESSSILLYRLVFKITEDYKGRTIEMKKWVVSEDCVTIECRSYVYLAVLSASIVLCGGLAIPFTVRDRISGVDPFNITMFAWLIAGLMLLFAKGRYVSEWPWHTFIHGHVVCRTLKEVCEVSGIESQLIIMYLLLNEWRTVLQTRGPFNSMFSRRTTDGSGFAIDESVHISTMVASGFFVLKVLNVFGEHLICLDVRRGSAFVSPMGVAERLMFRDLEEHDQEIELSFDISDGNEKDTIHNNPFKKLERGNLQVDRVLGLYIGDSYFG